MTNWTRPAVRSRKTTLAALRRDRPRRTQGRFACNLATGRHGGAKPAVPGGTPARLLPPMVEPEFDDGEDEPAVVSLLAGEGWVEPELEPELLDLGELVVVVVPLLVGDDAPVTEDTTDETT
jgi:hypothetical protein